MPTVLMFVLFLTITQTSMVWLFTLSDMIEGDELLGQPESQ